MTLGLFSCQYTEIISRRVCWLGGVEVALHVRGMVCGCEVGGRVGMSARWGRLEDLLLLVGDI